MFSPRIVFTAAIVLLMVELLVWKRSAPTSFSQQFDPVQREDIRIEPELFDLGNVAPREEQELSVTVKNLKNRSIVLQQPQSSCGCVRFKLDHAVELAPNETTVLQLDYKAPRTPGDIAKSVLIRVASAESAWRIPFKCTVVADAWCSPQDLELVMSDNKASEHGLVHFSNCRSIDFVVCSHPELMEVKLGPIGKKTQSFDVAVQSEEAGEGYVAFLDSNADHLITVPVSWREPNWIECCPNKITLDPTLKSNETYEVVVLRNPNKTKALRFEPAEPWIRIVRRRLVSEKVERFIIEVDSEAMPSSFSGPIVNVTDSHSGQTTSLKGKI